MTDLQLGVRFRAIWPYLATTAILGVVTIVVMRPAVFSCNSTIMGAPGDATSGGVWTAFNYLRTSGPPWLPKTPYTAAPTGEIWWHPYYITALLVFSPIWLFARITGSAVCGWNVAIASGYVASGLSMFALARHVSRSDTAARIVCLAYAFVPYRQFKAEGHIAYVHTYLFPLLLLTGLLVWQRPTRGRVVAAGCVLAVLGYTDGYYILLGAVAFASFHVSCLAWAAAVERWSWLELRKRIVAVVATGLIALVLLIPVLLAFVTTSSTISQTLTRGKAEVANYSARPLEYLLPARSHPVFDDVLGPWHDQHLHGSNYSESSLFLGLVVVVAAAAALLWLRKRHRRESSPLDGLTLGFLIIALAGTLLAGLLFSFPPKVRIGPIALLMPSGVVSSFATFWRVYARFFIVVHAAAAALAAVTLGRVFGHRAITAVPRTAISVVLVGIIAFENVVTWTPASWNYGLGPQAYRYVASRSDVDIIAEWPLLPTSMDPDHEYLTYVPIHGKKLVNVLENLSSADQIGRGIFGLSDAETPGVLRSLGADLVVVHRVSAPGDVPPADYELEASFTYAGDVATNPQLARRAARWAYTSPMHEVDVYRVKPGPKAEVALAIGAGFHDPEGDPAGISSRWLEQDGQLTVAPLGRTRGREATVAFAAESLQGEPRRVEIRQGGVVIWTGEVAGPRMVTFTAAVGRPMTVHATPGPKVSPDDTRRLSINVGALDILDISP